MDRRVAPDQSIEALSSDECILLLGSRDLGRIAFNVEGQPEVFPINYAMEGGIVVFRTAPGTKLDFVPKARLAFEVDDWDPKRGIGWSVVVKGLAEDVTRNLGRAAGIFEERQCIRSRPASAGTGWPSGPRRCRVGASRCGRARNAVLRTGIAPLLATTGDSEDL